MRTEYQKQKEQEVKLLQKKADKERKQWLKDEEKEDKRLNKMS